MNPDYFNIPLLSQILILPLNNKTFTHICIENQLLQLVQINTCNFQIANFSFKNGFSKKFLFRFEERQASVMKILFLLFPLVMLGAISSGAEEKHPIFQINEIRG